VLDFNESRIIVTLSKLQALEIKDYTLIANRPDAQFKDPRQGVGHVIITNYAVLYCGFTDGNRD